LSVSLVAVALCSAIPGCAGFWDEVTSRDFHFQDLYSKPNPMLVLQNSNDGDQRARALRALREPAQFGGSQEDQDAVVKILTTAASSEKQFLCRLAAIEALGHFKDARAVTGLSDAFYNSGTFPPELANRMQCEALMALGETANPQAIPLLVKVLKGAPAEGSEQEKQQVIDVRLAAARALGHFRNYEAVEALAWVLQHEKDVALCDCAYVSIQANVGKDLPPDFKDWDELLRKAKEGPGNPDANSNKLRLARWFGST
jgi:HEAT repeat protein